MRGGICPECREPRHYHSFCTLCAQPFGLRRDEWPVLEAPRSKPAIDTSRPRRGEVRAWRRQQIEALSAKRATRREAAETLGISMELVAWYCRAFGIPPLPCEPRPNRWSKDAIARLESMLASGMRQSEIAHSFARDPSSIAEVIARHLSHRRREKETVEASA